MLGQRLHGDGVARGDLGLRRQRAAEIAPMHPRRLDGQMMMRRLRIPRTRRNPTLRSRALSRIDHGWMRT
jgi:hypothetical protein